MKTILKLISVFIFAFAMAQNSPPTPPTPPPPPEMGCPEPPRPPKMDRKKMLERLSKTIELTPSQVAQIKKVDAAFEEKEREIDEKMKEIHEKRREIMKAKKAELDKILTPEQKEKLKEMRKEKRENRSIQKEVGHRGGNG